MAPPILDVLYLDPALREGMMRLASAGPLRLLTAIWPNGVVGVNPNPNGVPGAAAIQSIADGIAWWALLLSLLGLVIGAAAWALGSHSSNYQYATTGRRAVIVSGMAALVIGAAPAMINFFFDAGKQVH